MVANSAFDEIVEFLAKLSPKQVIDFKLSSRANQRAEDLVNKNKEGVLSEAEKSELDYFLVLEHIMRMAKATARKNLAP